MPRREARALRRLGRLARMAHECVSGPGPVRINRVPSLSARKTEVSALPRHYELPHPSQYRVA